MLTVHLAVIEQEDTISSQRCYLDFKWGWSNSEVSWISPVSIAHFKVVMPEKTAQKFLTDFASVSVAQHPVAYH